MRAFSAAFVAFVAALAIGCHSANRENPLDPELTPEIGDLSAAAFDSLGFVILQWSAYNGERPFSSYLVLRKEQGLERVDTLATLTSVETTSFSDATALPDREYEYRIAVRNRSGYLAPGAPALARSYQVFPVQDLSTIADNSSGVIALSWSSYDGPGFERYEIWRESFGVEDQRLAALPSRAVTAWTDTSVVPGTLYSYKVRVIVFDQGLDTESRPISFELTAPQIDSLQVDWRCACARLGWTRYDGPGFTGYDVWRSADGVPDSLVAHLSDRDSTSLTDSLLAGNTSYSYRIAVGTVWPGVVAESAQSSGGFYLLRDVQELSAAPDTEVRAIDLAIDDSDGVWAVSTAISTTTARQMRPGLRVHAPGGQARVHFSQDFDPGILSSVRAVMHGQTMYAAIADEADSIRVVAISDDNTALWHVGLAVGTPAGIYVDERDGEELVIVDREGISYHRELATGDAVVDDEGAVRENYRISLANNEGLPIHDLYYDKIGDDFDRAFLLTPSGSQHKLVSRLWVGPFFGGAGGAFFDNGVGPGLGQLLNPLTIGFDYVNLRLVVIENQGRLQVMDGFRQGQPNHYITGWGRYGSSEGEFLVSPSTAVSVITDAQGAIHVADAGAPGGRIQTFVP